jgi:Zn-dependent protease with chaperone function
MATLFKGHSNEKEEVSLRFSIDTLYIDVHHIEIPLKEANITYISKGEISLYFKSYTLQVFPTDAIFNDLHQQISKKKKSFLLLSVLSISLMLIVLSVSFNNSDILIEFIPDKTFEIFYNEEQIEMLLGESICEVKPEIAQKVLRDFGIKENYKLKILKSDMLNAFAYPKDSIVFTQKLLERIDDDEFHAVLGHEVGHHFYAHYKPAILRAILAGLIFNTAQTPDMVTNLITSLFNASHSKEAERESDAHAVKLMKGAGLDLSANITVMRKLGSQESESKYLSIMSTHPLTNERLEFFEAEKTYKGSYSNSRDLIEKLIASCLDS